MDFYYSAASGSSGNCGVWQAGGTAILIDLGVSVRALKTALRTVDLDIPSLAGVVLTHEHIDHIKGLATFVKHYDLPIYATFGTAAAILQKTPQAEKNLRPFAGGEAFSIGALQVQSLPISHDAAEPVAYRIDGGGHRLGYVTDTGFLPEEVRLAVSGCDTVVLESNHDVDMLRNGPYPPYLQARIHGTHGHLSNEDCAKGAAALVKSGAKRLILAHLSEKNNNPLTALRCTQRALKGADCTVYVAPRGAMEAPIPLEEELQCSMFG